METTTVHVEIKGTRPLMQHRFPNPKETLGKKGKKADNRTDEQIAIDGIHFTSDGFVYHPAEAIEKAIHSGAKGIIKKGRTTWMKDFQAAILVSPDQPHLLCDGNPLMKDGLNGVMVIDGRKAINRTNNAAVWAIRPKFPEWSIKFELLCTNEAIQHSIIEEAITLAGRFNGLGAFRTNPRFGRFELVSFKVEK